MNTVLLWYNHAARIVLKYNIVSLPKGHHEDVRSRARKVEKKYKTFAKQIIQPSIKVVRPKYHIIKRQVRIADFFLFINKYIKVPSCVTV